MKEAIRTCIAEGCSAKFLSKSPAHRICPKCKANQEWIVSQWDKDTKPPDGWWPFVEDRHKRKKGEVAHEDRA